LSENGLDTEDNSFLYGLVKEKFLSVIPARHHTNKAPWKMGRENKIAAAVAETTAGKISRFLL
jgi:hypothetical protein